MNRFFRNIFLFLLPIPFVFLIGIIAPPTPRGKVLMYYSGVQKDSLLKHTPSPRLIFVGGSNITYGINSQTIKDSLHINPINTAVNAGIGLPFMLRSTLPYIREGDVVVLIPEYHLFYDDPDQVGTPLLRSIVDVDITKARFLSIEQFLKLLPYLPFYGFSKYNILEYFHAEESPMYSPGAFNQYGDGVGRLDAKEINFSPEEHIEGPFRPEMVKEIQSFYEKIQEKGAELWISYPSFQATSFENISDQITHIERELRNADLPIIARPSRYKMPDSTMFDTVYHLNKTGVERRTALLIEDLSAALSN